MSSTSSVERDSHELDSSPNHQSFQPSSPQQPILWNLVQRFTELSLKPFLSANNHSGASTIQPPKGSTKTINYHSKHAVHSKHPLTRPPSARPRNTRDNLILDEFLKNNGGYLDDSDSSGSSGFGDEFGEDDDDDDSDDDDDDENDEQSEDRQPPSENIRDKRIKIFSKKYQNSVASPTIHHRHRYSKNVYLQAGSKHPPLAASSDRIEDFHGFKNPGTPIVGEKHRRACTNTPAIDQLEGFLGYHYLHRPKHADDDQLNLNSQYIKSSTFPIKNSIIVQSSLQHSHHHHQSHPFSSTTSSQDGDCTLSSNDSSCKPFRSTFRNLVLCQDDLLRSL